MLEKQPKYDPNFPESGLAYVGGKLVDIVGLAEHCFDGNSQMLRVISVPTPRMQTEYAHGEGPGIMSRSHILREASPSEAYYYLRAQILLERITPKFPQIKTFVSLPPWLILLSEHMTGQKRWDICNQLVGAYPRNSIYFAAADNLSPEKLDQAQKTILLGTLPSGWEITRSNDSTWATKYPVFGG